MELNEIESIARSFWISTGKNYTEIAAKILHMRHQEEADRIYQEVKAQ